MPAEEQRSGAPWAAIAAGAAVIVLVATSAGVVGGFERGDANPGSAALRAAIGAGIGLLIAGLIIAIVVATGHGKRLRNKSSWLLLAGLIGLLAALAAILGASTTPRHNPDADSATTTTSGAGGGGGDNSTDIGPGESVEPNGGVMDQKTGRVFVDTNGDGIADSELVPCPPTTGGSLKVSVTSAVPTTAPPNVGDRVPVNIDNDCDGTVDKVIYVEVRDHAAPGNRPTPRSSQPNPPPAEPKDNKTSAADVGKSLLILLLVLLAVAVVVAIVAIARGWRPKQRSTPEDLPPPDSPPLVDEEAAADSLARSRQIIDDSPDPRAAIITAYAALLDGLQAAGAGRLPYEAPEEHLQRSLAQIGVPPDSLRDVTRLFLIAKFSTHDVTEDDRRAAQDALGVAEQHLRVVIDQRAAVAGTSA